MANGGQLTASPNHDSKRVTVDQVELDVEQYGSIVVPRDQIKRIESPQVTEDEYFDHASKFADTAEDQWKLAQWCKSQGLDLCFHRHAARVLELDPEFADARYALGYQRRSGRWVSQDEIMRDRGYIRHGGRWTTVQEIALDAARAQRRANQVEWAQYLKRWRQRLGKEHGPTILINFDQVSDPDAVPGLIQLLGRENNRELAYRYLETLGRIESSQGRTFLMENAIFQNDPNFRHRCQQEVLSFKHPKMVEFYVVFLNHYDRNIVNRAAVMLAKLDYPTAIAPLANALHTRHLTDIAARGTYFHTTQAPTPRFDIVGPKASFRRMSLSEFFARTNNVYGTEVLANPGVHRALVELCDGEDFGYDPNPWKAWYKKAYAPKSPPIRLSRDL
ncbi:hypothetical protein C5Y93_17450 [Blastopirellula marina]|uniref:Uncharacterized protein n=1 Tax=Blastopirellula marina TaxID=124 RepID=A0A2S8GKC0_9BACT|nr:hypothetical protein C5Y93_17450 [Blastopirellula marina]